MISLELKNNFENIKDIVNDAVKICIECGGMNVNIDFDKIICNDCNSQFVIEGKN